MKKQMLILTLLMSSLLVSPVLGLAAVKHALGLDKGSKSTKSSNTKEVQLDRVEFWNAVIKAFKKSGYAEDSPEMKHANEYLLRAQRRKAKGDKYFAKAFALKSKKDKSDDRKKEAKKAEIKEEVKKEVIREKKAEKRAKQKRKLARELKDLEAKAKSKKAKSKKA